MHRPGDSLNVIQTTRAGEVVGTLAFCVRDHLNAATATSVWMIDWSFLEPGTCASTLTVQGNILTLQRNECIRMMQGSWTIFIDDDMVFQPDAVRRLHESWVETQARYDEPVIMGGLCFRRAAPYDPTLYMREAPTYGSYRFLERWDHDIVEVDATGFAFLLVPATALEAIVGAPMPPYDDRRKLTLPQIFRWQSFGEDLTFCQDAKKAGCRIFVDTRIEIGHVSEVTITKRDYFMSIASRPPETEEYIRAANDVYGLPTLSAAEALEAIRELA